MSIARLVGLIFALASALAPAAHATHYAVDVVIDSIDAIPGDGMCADASGSCSLRAAVQEANATPGADSIALAAAHYVFALVGLEEEAAASGDIDIVGDLEIRGAGVAATTIDAAALDRLLDLRPGVATSQVRLQELTLRNGAAVVPQGLAAPTSAGIRVGAGVHLVLVDVVLRDNVMTTFNGGAALDIAGCVEGERVRILDNGDPASAGSARPLSGGIAVRGETACLHLLDSEISRNRGDISGAIYLRDQPIVSIRRSLIADNVARFAGAIEISDAQTVLLENTTISGNRGNPGAILNDGFARLTLIHCTVTGNRAAQSSTNVGGIQDVHGGFGRTFLSNTIIAGNGPGFIADDCDRAVSVGGGNLIGDSAECNFSAEPSDQLGIDPGLGSLADHGGFTRTHAVGIAVIDRAAASMCTTLDQRALSRPVDGDGNGSAECDVGAFEARDDALFADGFDPR
jgi:hypothetical protein